MDSQKSNKIRDIVRLQQILKKWRNLAISSKNCAGGTSSSTVPKGYLAVCVGEEQKRYIIPMEYLDHQAFHILLREAEEEFGFQQMGVLRIPCEVPVFENILKLMEEKKDISSLLQECRLDVNANWGCRSSKSQQTPSHNSQSPVCR